MSGLEMKAYKGRLVHVRETGRIDQGDEATPPMSTPAQGEQAGSYPEFVWYTPEDNSSMKYVREDRTDARLIEAALELLPALRALASNARGLSAFEHEIREVAGNTNWQCLMDAVANADAAIASLASDPNHGR